MKMTREAAKEYIERVYRGHWMKEILDMAYEGKEGTITVSKKAMDGLDEAYEHFPLNAPSIPELVHSLSNGEMAYDEFYTSNTEPYSAGLPLNERFILKVERIRNA